MDLSALKSTFTAKVVAPAAIVLSTLTANIGDAKAGVIATDITPVGMASAASSSATTVEEIDFVTASVQGTIDDVNGFTTLNAGDIFSFDFTIRESLLVDQNDNPAIFAASIPDFANAPDSGAVLTVNGVELQGSGVFFSVLDNFLGTFDGPSFQFVTNDTIEGQGFNQVFIGGEAASAATFEAGVRGLTEFGSGAINSEFSFSGVFNQQLTDFSRFTETRTQVDVPEPGALALFGLGLFGLGVRKYVGPSSALS